MLKIYKILEVGYLFFAILFFIEAFLTFGSNKNKALIFAGLAIMATFMFFFKRKFRKKRFKNKQQN